MVRSQPGSKESEAGISGYAVPKAKKNKQTRTYVYTEMATAGRNLGVVVSG